MIDNTTQPYCAYCKKQSDSPVEAAIHARHCTYSPLVQEIRELKAKIKLAKSWLEQFGVGQDELRNKFGNE